MSIIFLEIDGFCSLPSLDSVFERPSREDLTKVSSPKSNFVKTPSTACRIAETLESVKHLVVNYPDSLTLQTMRTHHPHCQITLFTDQALSSLKKEFGKDPLYKKIDHIIYSGSSERLSTDLLRYTLTFLPQSMPSLADHLQNGPFTREDHEVASTHDRSKVVHKLREFSLRTGVSSNLITHLCAVAEELMMNAVIDAPIAAGVRNVANLSHEEDFELSPEHRPKVSFYRSDEIFIIRVTDPFGLFKRESFFKYVEKITQPLPSDTLVESKSYGAGLGIYKIFHSCHALICRVDPGRSSELTAILSLDEKLRSVWQAARTIQYFLG